MAAPDRQGPKRRQSAHRSASAGPRPGRSKRENRERERVRDVARRPKKYFVARRLQESELTPAASLAQPARRRRPTAAVGRAPAIGPETLVREIMVTDVVTIHADATLFDAARLMRDANVGMLPVVSQDRLHGVVTDRDLVVRAMAAGVEPGAVPVRDCLTDQVSAAGPDWTTDRAMQTMATAKLGRLPVVDDRQRVVGVVTLSSLVLRGRNREEALETAKEVSRRSARRAPAA
jgi:CBS domain-containing protein